MISVYSVVQCVYTGHGPCILYHPPLCPQLWSEVDMFGLQTTVTHELWGGSQDSDCSFDFNWLWLVIREEREFLVIMTEEREDTVRIEKSCFLFRFSVQVSFCAMQRNSNWCIETVWWIELVQSTSWTWLHHTNITVAKVSLERSAFRSAQFKPLFLWWLQCRSLLQCSE